MKKVVLLGDSIRLIGYGKKVPELLGSDYEVWQPEENCRFAKYTLRMLFDYADKLKEADIIHWNNGLWDTCDLFGEGRSFSDVDEYTENMVRIATILKRYTDKIIFATTTPITTNPHNTNENIAYFNACVVEKLVPLGVVINDLYSTVMSDLEANICDDGIHLSETAIDICAKQVAEAIQKLA